MDFQPFCRSKTYRALPLKGMAGRPLGYRQEYRGTGTIEEVEGVRPISRRRMLWFSLWKSGSIVPYEPNEYVDELVASWFF